MSNGTEQLAVTHPRKTDSDRNGTPDGLEDPDADGLPNAGESTTYMHPRKADTDGDGIPDGERTPASSRRSAVRPSRSPWPRAAT